MIKDVPKDLPRSRGRRRRVRRPMDSIGVGLLLLLPTVLLTATYKYGPIGEAFWASTKVFNVSGQVLGAAGWSNFSNALADADFTESLVLTTAFALVKIPLQLALGVGAALLLFRSSKFNSLVRVSMIIPAVTPIVIVGIIFLFLFDKEIGLTNTMLQLVGVGKVGWFTEPGPARAVVVFVSIWRDAGFTMLIYLAGLTAVPREVLEAARVDGATPWQTNTRVVLPLLQRSTQLAAVTTTIGAFQLFAPIFVMTRGGPQSATDVAAYHVYQEAFVFYDQGMANAMAIILVVVIMIITGLELYLLRSRWEH